MRDLAAVIVAAGRSSRFGDRSQKKVFALINHRAVWLHAADAFVDHPRLRQLILVIHPEDREYFQEKFGGAVTMMGIQVVDGGQERWQSVQRGLEHVSSECSLVAIHDGARPCIAREWLDDVVAAAEKHQAAILGSPIYSTIKRVQPDGLIAATVPRERLWQAHTPQVFRRELILRAYAERKIANPTDDSELVESLGVQVAMVECSPLNIKVTNHADLRTAEFALKSLPKNKPFPFG